MHSQDSRLAVQAFTDAEGTPRPPIVGGTSCWPWLFQDADSLFHKWRVVNCAEPSNLPASGSQEDGREQHLTGRNNRNAISILKSDFFRDVGGQVNMRVEGSTESEVRGRHWGRDRGVGYPVLIGSLDRCAAVI